MNTQIIEMAGLIVVCGAFYLIALKEKKSKEKALDRVIDLRVEIDGLNEIIEEDNKVMSKRMEQMGDLQEDVRKDGERINDLEGCLNRASEENEFLKETNSARYTETEYLRKKNSDIQHKLCNANMELVNLEEELKFMKKIGFRKIERARRLVK